MGENLKWVAAGVGVVALFAALFIYFSPRSPVQPATPPVAVAPPPPPAEEQDVIKHPIAAAPGEAAAPPLEASDQPLFDALAGLAGKAPVEQYVIPQDLVRHFVVTIDNLPTEKVAERVRPMKAVPGKFAVSGPDDAPTLDAANYARYEPLVKTLQATDTGQLVALYQRYYPLFQQVYEGLGHPPQYFNDRVVEVIDHLLATPDVRGPIGLVQPSVQYKYADPKLEALSAGQKALIRMGSANATAIKEKLRALRAALVAQKPN
jgi:hypothetical protein